MLRGPERLNTARLSSTAMVTGVLGYPASAPVFLRASRPRSVNGEDVKPTSFHRHVRLIDGKTASWQIPL